MRTAEDNLVQAAQKQILQEYYNLREILYNEVVKLGSGQAAGPAPTGEASTVGELYQVREKLKEEIQKSAEVHEAAINKLNFRIDHLKKNFITLYEENERLKKENAELKSKVPQ